MNVNLKELLVRDRDRHGNRGWPPVPEVTTYEQLLDLHRQLIEEFTGIDSARTAMFNAAAVILRDVMAGHKKWTADSRTLLPRVVEALIDGLRFTCDPGRLIDPNVRFAAATRWSDHMWLTDLASAGAAPVDVVAVGQG